MIKDHLLLPTVQKVIITCKWCDVEYKLINVLISGTGKTSIAAEVTNKVGVGLFTVFSTHFSGAAEPILKSQSQ